MSERRTIKVLRGVLAFGLLGASVGASTVASAQPVAVIHRLPEATAAELRRDVKQARDADPRPFIVTNDIVRNARSADQAARARKAPIALQLARLGPSGLLPMLEILAEGTPKTVPADGVQAIRRDLIEAVGLLRQPRSLAVVGAILDDPTEEEDTTRTAAEAVARLGTDEAANRVVRALDGATDAVRARAILAGMGECRRLRVADAIASRLRTTTDDATARIAARSLGRAGNAWAWKTTSDRAEEARVRESAARALVEAFVHRTGEARTAADNALMVVDDLHTPTLIAEARRGASPETIKALDALAVRFANNPAR
jgi:hypothetical protein